MNTKSHLAALEAESIHIIREVVAEFENPVMLYSIGKDSAVMLHLAMEAFYPGKPPFPIMHVDTLWKFREGSSKKPSFPRRRESSTLIFLGSRIRGNDESQVFRGTREMYAMRDQINEKHGLQLLVHVNEEGRAAGVNPFTHGSKVHTDVMKTEGLKQAA